MLQPAADAPWQDQLTAAFEILLGRPLSDYDPGATYAAFFGGNFMYEMGYHQDPAWLDMDALTGRKTITVGDLSLYYLDEPLLQFDASGSIFEFVMGALPADFAAELAGACFAPRLITGRALASALERQPISLATPQFAGAWSVAYPRIASNGTLWDAMRVATGLGHGPDSLISPEEEASEEWQTRLAAISHPELRAHMALACADPWASEGLAFTGLERSGGPLLEEAGCAVIANWEEGQCQREVAVVRLGAMVA